MSLTRIILFIVGLLLIGFGLYQILGLAFDVVHIILGLVLIVIGIFVLKGGPVTM